MSKQFFVSGSNATFDLSGVKQEAPQIITDPNAPVHADRSIFILRYMDLGCSVVMHLALVQR
jgi:hypothetical protein